MKTQEIDGKLYIDTTPAIWVAMIHDNPECKFAQDLINFYKSSNEFVTKQHIVQSKKDKKKGKKPKIYVKVYRKLEPMTFELGIN